MELALTIAILLVCLAATVFAGWKSGRPRKDSLNVQWISWPMLTVLAGAALAFALVHLLNLMGFHTGANLAQKYQF